MRVMSIAYVSWYLVTVRVAYTRVKTNKLMYLKQTNKTIINYRLKIFIVY